MYVALTALAECLLTGLVTGLTIWGLAKVGLIPIMLVTYTDDEETADE